MVEKQTNQSMSTQLLQLQLFNSVGTFLLSNLNYVPDFSLGACESDRLDKLITSLLIGPSLTNFQLNK